MYVSDFHLLTSYRVCLDSPTPVISKLSFLHKPHLCTAFMLALFGPSSHFLAGFNSSSSILKQLHVSCLLPLRSFLDRFHLLPVSLTRCVSLFAASIAKLPWPIFTPKESFHFLSDSFHLWPFFQPLIA
jgi:hypothetical protein